MSPLDDPDLGSFWDLSDSAQMVKGGYQLDGQHFYAPTSPVSSYPFWVVGWLRSGGTSKSLLTFHGGSGNEHGIRSGSGTLVAYSDNGSVGAAEASINSAIWSPYVAIFLSPSSRSIHTRLGSDTDTASLTGILPTQTWFGKHPLLSQDWVGNVGPHWIFTSTPPDSGEIAALLAGAAPSSPTAYYPFDRDDGLAAIGSPDLQMTGQPTPLDHILLLRDQGPNAWHLGQAFGSPYEVPLFHPSPPRAIFSKSPFTHLVRLGITTPAPPFQVYAVAGVNDNTSKHAIFSLAQNSGAGQNWVLQMRGDLTGNPLRWKVAGGQVDTSLGFEPFTTYLLWAREASAVDHKVRLDDANEGSSVESLIPTSVVNVGIGQEFGIGTNDCMDGFVQAIWTLNTASVSSRDDHVAFAQSTFDVGSTELDDLATPIDDPALLSSWDFTDLSSLIVGGFRMDGVDDYFDALSVPPGVNSYPFWVVAYIQIGSPATLITFHSSTDEKGIYIDSQLPRIYSKAGATVAEAVASAAANQRWIPIIGVWESPTLRKIYTPTGYGEDTTSVSPGTLDKTSVGRHPVDGLYWGPPTRALGPIWAFNSSSPTQPTINAILRGEDPALVAGCVAYWPMQEDGEDAIGSVELTVHSAPIPTNHVIIARDKGRNKWHLQQYDSLNTSNCPTWDGEKLVLGGSPISGEYEYLEHRAPMKFKAPFQVFAVAAIGDEDRKGCVFSVVGNADGVWTLQMKGDIVGKHVRWFVDIDGGDQTAEAATSNSFSEDVPHTLWALEAKSNQRAVELDAAGEGTNVDSIEPGTAYQLDVGVTGGPPVGESETDWFPGQVYAIWLLDTADVANKTLHEDYAAFLTSEPEPEPEPEEEDTTVVELTASKPPNVVAYGASHQGVVTYGS